MKKVTVKLTWYEKVFIDEEDGLNVKEGVNGNLAITKRKPIPNSTMTEIVALAKFNGSAWLWYTVE